MNVIVTGVAGFIGMHAAARLLERGDRVIGVDDLNPYPDPVLKQARLERLQGRGGFSFERTDMADASAMESLFDRTAPGLVLHLAARPGVRESLDHPQACVTANVTGFLQVLEGCRRHGVGHLVYASSSSVYGTNTRLPFEESQAADHPVSIYAATKRADELLAHAYSEAFRLPITGARLFTVYGPWGRSDMAVYRFTRAILENRPLDIYNEGQLVRDFTYVDDVVAALLELLDKPATPSHRFGRAHPDPAESDAPHRVFNVGGGQAVPLLEFVALLEQVLGRAARRRYLPMQSGDVHATQACCDRLHSWTGWQPQTTLEDGLRRFAEWFCDYHGVAR
ncbi:NAD-dependent epimerase/dehydratase family protein [Ramlibacter tataouinensis]|uniref:NAD-dependent epimerase/dehydratase family protein n=1 Tax=Ramlibacter tataouinensis TaxID=94132 RepID=UPI0022F397ED|nr:NAD-dependent epimerase/dehydratase family protein [Ramlibacter tataouinensis]WBY02966.1 NAD-dependent epimerase/dehydratase family protein [Ramlibacter tataouinensis]